MSGDAEHLPLDHVTFTLAADLRRGNAGEDEQDDDRQDQEHLHREGLYGRGARAGSGGRPHVYLVISLHGTHLLGNAANMPNE
jgi:hypothetical protein